MAAQASAAAMQRHVRIAAQAGRAPATVVTQQHRCKAPTVDEQQGLASSLKMPLNGFEQRCRQTVIQPARAYIERMDQQQNKQKHTTNKKQKPKPTTTNNVQRLQRRRRAAEQHR